MLKKYEKPTHAHNYRFFWKGLVLINAGLFEGNFFWVGQYDPPPPPPPLSPNLYIRRKTNPILIQFLSNLSKIPSQKTADIIF